MYINYKVNTVGTEKLLIEPLIGSEDNIVVDKYGRCFEFGKKGHVTKKGIKFTKKYHKEVCSDMSNYLDTLTYIGRKWNLERNPIVPNFKLFEKSIEKLDLEAIVNKKALIRFSK